MSFERASYQRADLNEILDMARNNAIKSLMHVFFGILLAVFIIIFDHPQIGILSSAIEFAHATRNVIWIGKWFFIFAIMAYVFSAIGHLFRSLRHSSEARFLIHQSEAEVIHYD